MEHARWEEVAGMLTSIGRALDRFWNGPWIAPAGEGREPRYEFRDPRPEDQRLAEEAYWRNEHDEDDGAPPRGRVHSLRCLLTGVAPLAGFIRRRIYARPGCYGVSDRARERSYRMPPTARGRSQQPDGKGDILDGR